MKSGIIFNQREIILIPFPYFDLSGNKKRPALILSNKEYNIKNNNLICCMMSSSTNNLNRGIVLENNNLEFGKLPKKTAVMPSKLFTPDKKIIIKSFGKIEKTKSEEIWKYLTKSLKLK